MATSRDISGKDTKTSATPHEEAQTLAGSRSSSSRAARSERMTSTEAFLARRKQKQPVEDAQVTVWPSSFPEDIGSIAPAGTELSVDSDELGSRFLNDPAEHGPGPRQVWYDEYEDAPFDERAGNELLRSFGLSPMRNRASTRPQPARRAVPIKAPKAPRLPIEFEDYIVESGEIDLTEVSIRDASLLDHEGEEAGEIESPFVRTDDTHTHNKRRGGHAPTSMRPPRPR
jgi:hypothetical protein